MVDLKQLRYFLAIAEAGSFSRAGETLGVSQPALSLKLAALEDELGVRLFERGNRGVALTRQGEFLRQHATGILSGVDELVGGLRRQDRKARGPLRVGIPGMALHTLGAPLVRHVVSRYPNVRLTVEEDQVGRLRIALLEGRLDLAVLIDEPADSPFVATPLVMEQYCVLGPPEKADGSDTIDWAALGRLPLLLSGGDTTLRRFCDTAARAQGVRLDVIAELNSQHLLKAAVRDGLGYTILPWSTISFDFDARTLWLRRIVRPELRALVVLAASRTARPGLAQRAIQSLMLDLAGDLVARGLWKGVLPVEREAMSPLAAE